MLAIPSGPVIPYADLEVEATQQGAQLVHAIADHRDPTWAHKGSGVCIQTTAEADKGTRDLAKFVSVGKAGCVRVDG